MKESGLAKIRNDSNTKGVRNDVLESFRKNLEYSCFTMAWEVALPMNTTGKMALVPRRPQRMINTHWGGVVENNHFGTHEFMMSVRLLECEPYIGGNVGSGTVQEMSEWVEYMTFDGESPMANLRKENGRKSHGKLNISVSAMKTGAAAEICVQNITLIYIGDIRLMYAIMGKIDI